MTYFDSLPLTIIKKLIKAQILESYPHYKIDFGSLNLDEDDMEPFEDEADDTIQAVRVMLHINTPDENDPARCWHPWLFIWNCNESRFESFMRDDQTKQIDIDVLADDMDEIADNEEYESLIDFAPIKVINMRHIMAVGKELKYEYEDKQKRTLYDVLSHISQALAETSDADFLAPYQDHSIIISRLHVHDNGECYVNFEPVPYDDEQE